MLRLILNNLLKRRERASLIAVSAVLIAAAFALFASASSATTVSADQALSQYWRTTYDILVRHPDYVTDIEKEYGLVEANHLSGTPGGISFAEYEFIKSIEGVEVAAPIAMLGYLPRDPIVFGIRDPLNPGFFRITASSRTSNGYEAQEYSLPGSYFVLYSRGWELGVPPPSKETRDGLSDEVFRLGLGGSGWLEDFFGLGVRLPSFNDRALLAAVDPEQEAALIDLEGMLVEGRYLLQESGRLSDDHGEARIPMLLNISDYIDQEVSIRVEQISIGDFPMLEGGYENEDFLQSVREIEDFASIESAPREVVWEGTYSINREWRKVGLSVQILNGEFLDPIRWTSSFSGQLLQPGPVNYRVIPNPPDYLFQDMMVLEAIPAGVTESKQSIDVQEFLPEDWLQSMEQTLWSREPEIIFRNLEPRFAEYISITPILQGFFEVDTDVALNGASPNQVPLETYLPPLVTLKYDSEGNQVLDNPTLRPTLNNEGYLISPPDLLISLEDAKYWFEGTCYIFVESEIERHYFDPQETECTGPKDKIISAIRIRVGGIEELTPEAQVRIERIAEEIVEKTGLHVDIMVGSSPEPVLVHIPGYEEVPALGYVEELWVKKGVSTLVSAGINRADGLLFGLMLLVSGLFLFSANYVSVLGRIPEFGVLMALGWRRRTLFGMILGEGLLLGLFSSALGALAAWGIVQTFALPVATERILLLIPLGSLLFLLGSLLPAWRAARAQPQSIIGSGEARASSWAPRASGLFGYALGGVLRRPGRTLVTVLGLALSSAFLVLLTLILDGLDGALYGTLLGAWVRTQVQPFHFMMAAVALLAAALGTAVLMLLNIMQRRNEIGLLVALGWRRADLLRMFLLESAILSLISGLLGSLLGLAVFYAIYPAPAPAAETWLQLVGLGVLLPLVVVEIATLYPADRGARLLPLEAFRGEERLASNLGLGRAVAWIGLLGSAGLVLAIGLFWARGGLPEPPATPVVAAVEEPSQIEYEAAREPQATPTPVALEQLPNYTVSLDLATDLQSASGEARIEFTNQTGQSLDEILLRLYANYPDVAGTDGSVLHDVLLRVQEVSVNGRAADFELSNYETVLTIPLAVALQPGQALNVELGYSYELPRPSGENGEIVQVPSFVPLLAVYDEDGWRTDVCEACLDDFYQAAANFNFAINAPTGWEVVASGELRESTTLEDGQIRHQFQAQAARDPIIALNPDLTVQSLEAEGTALKVYSLEDEDNFAEAIGASAQAAFAYYQEQFGPYPFAELDLVAVPFFGNTGAAYAQFSFIFYEEIGEDLDRIVGRYVANQWWGQTVGADAFHETWLREGLAEYSTLLFLADYLGEEVAEDYLRRYHTDVAVLELENRREYAVGQSVDSLNEDGPFVYRDVSRYKGALFLDEVREVVGEEAFFAGLQSYYAQQRFGVGNGAAFLEAMSQAAGLDLSPLFEQWGIFSEL